MTFSIVSLSVTVALALLGFAATYLNNLALARRKERLELVTKQLNEFYGPLYVASKTSHAAFQALVVKLGAAPGSIAKAQDAKTSPALAEWRLWVKTVLMPLNSLQEQLILRNAHLIREPEVPGCLLQFAAHHAAYKAVVAKWEQGDYSEHLSIIGYPEGLLPYASQSFAELKALQLALVGKSGV